MNSTEDASQPARQAPAAMDRLVSGVAALLTHAAKASPAEQVAAAIAKGNITAEEVAAAEVVDTADDDGDDDRWTTYQPVDPIPIPAVGVHTVNLSGEVIINIEDSRIVTVRARRDLGLEQ